MQYNLFSRLSFFRDQNVATWVASIASIFTLIVSLFSLYETRQTRIAVTQDEVAVHLKRLGNSLLKINKRNAAMRYGAIVAQWSVLISNTGSSTVSIVSCEISQATSGDNVVMYGGLDGGLKQNETEEASLPLSLESGKSIQLIVSIGLNPGKRAYETLLEELHGASGSISTFKAEQILAAKSIDIYDNNVVPLMSNNEVYGWSIGDRPKEQVFVFKVQTARNVKSFGYASWYN